jgi:hypothetical protein
LRPAEGAERDVKKPESKKDRISEQFKILSQYAPFQRYRPKGLESETDIEKLPTLLDWALGLQALWDKLKELRKRRMNGSVNRFSSASRS